MGKKEAMERALTGSIKREGYGLAGKRLKDCASLLAKYGMCFPSLYFGTINIRLDEPFPTPAWPNIIHIPQNEIDKVARGYQEWWKFIPVKQINGMNIHGFIYRNRQHVHGDSGAELITVDLRNNPSFDLRPGFKINFLVEIPLADLTTFTDGSCF